MLPLTLWISGVSCAVFNEKNGRQISFNCYVDTFFFFGKSRIWPQLSFPMQCFRRQGDSTSVTGRNFKQDILVKPGWLVTRWVGQNWCHNGISKSNSRCLPTVLLAWDQEFSDCGETNLEDWKPSEALKSDYAILNSVKGLNLLIEEAIASFLCLHRIRSHLLCSAFVVPVNWRLLQE